MCARKARAAALGGWESSSTGGRGTMHVGMEMEAWGRRARGSDLDWICEREGGSGGWSGRGSELGFGWLGCRWDEDERVRECGSLDLGMSDGL